MLHAYSNLVKYILHLVKEYLRNSEECCAFVHQFKQRSKHTHTHTFKHESEGIDVMYVIGRVYVTEESEITYRKPEGKQVSHVDINVCFTRYRTRCIHN